ncbi:GNAT family N-acetyltransferase [Peribacillus alkalitolerans]|uniref:GNAT family N-acetyltransferase n=1 Tax=Peribacillus alkalitolerans TaxID=1550385 RepID=UPI001F07ED13|nr:GNAT family N-acetyltransferase [Peribacillus alkalitolerans]
MAVALKKIDNGNWEYAIGLTVKDEQKSFMVSNLYSIAEVQFLDNFQAMGVYDNEEMIGFCMFGIDSDDGNYWIYRLMIDEKFQGQGFGVKAVKKIIEQIKVINDTHIPYIMIGYHPENIGAQIAYKKAGFVETEVASWGEQLAAYHLV